MQRGTILRWNAEKGWGFAKPDRQHFNIFVHATKIIDGVPHDGAVIEFEMGEHKRRPYANKVRVVK